MTSTISITVLIALFAGFAVSFFMLIAKILYKIESDNESRNQKVTDSDKYEIYLNALEDRYHSEKDDERYSRPSPSKYTQMSFEAWRESYLYGPSNTYNIRGSFPYDETNNEFIIFSEEDFHKFNEFKSRDYLKPHKTYKPNRRTGKVISSIPVNVRAITYASESPIEIITTLHHNDVIELDCTDPLIGFDGSYFHICSPVVGYIRMDYVSLDPIINTSREVHNCTCYYNDGSKVTYSDNNAIKKDKVNKNMYPLGMFGDFLDDVDPFAEQSNPHELSEKQIYDMIHAPIVLELYPLYKPYSPEDEKSKEPESVGGISEFMKLVALTDATLNHKNQQQSSDTLDYAPLALEYIKE